MNKKYLKGLLSLSLSGMMAASLAAPVFADTNTNPTDTTTTNPTDTNTNPADAKAYITKQFDMPVGTTLPSNAAFTFNEGPISKDDKPSTVTLDNKEVNNLGDKVINCSNSTKKTIEVNGAGNEHKIYRYLASTPLLTDADKTALKTAGPGVYTFTIKEKIPTGGNMKDNVEAKSNTDDTTHIQKDTALTYSKAEYKATVYVKTGANGAYIGTIKVSKEKDDQGHAITTENEKKVDPSQPDDNIPGSGGLRFVNTYTEKIKNTKPGDPGTVIPNPDPSDPTKPDNRDKILSVGKIVSGDLGNKDTKFTFTVKVTQPSLVTSTDTDTYKAQVFKPDGTPVGKELAFTSGVATPVSLSHGEKLVFEDLYVGTAFEAQETDPDTEKSYTSSTYARLNGGNPTEKVKERALVKGNVSENTDTVVVVNTRNSTSPTGIVVNNLPYILLVLGVVAGFAGYIASKRRREVR
ncbi:DUF7601 domain-containing protein [Intestinibaculum porci]|uniref:DUF7601 domain-containing protein n=1 Tax=Intestinibaculum porci TaxID=2487118 RepID=UPI0024095AA9|nr:hypothetical protein [Intestinibaculum porci]MDD6349798.1 hypothetical protein [Intestinibaculum porci]